MAFGMVKVVNCPICCGTASSEKGCCPTCGGAGEVTEEWNGAHDRNWHGALVSNDLILSCRALPIPAPTATFPGLAEAFV